MSTTYWAIIAKPVATGAILHPRWPTASGKTPADCGFPGWDPATMEAKQVSGMYDPNLSGLDRTTWTWVKDAAKLEKQLVDWVKVEAERRRMMILTAGGSKKMIYAKKQAEVEYWNTLGSTLAAILTALALVPAATRTRKLRYAYAEAAKRGEANPSFAIARFTTGVDASETNVARLEAIEQVACANIKAATTAGQKQSIYNAINWDA